MQHSIDEGLRVGSRGSKLALAQAGIVRLKLYTETGIATTITSVTTTGDRVNDVPLSVIGGKGVFAKELEEALLSNRIDIAVHSMKDLPVEIPPGLKIVAVPERGTPADAFVSRKARRLEDLPKGSSIGTSSVRRAAQIARRRPDLQIVPLRGNVDTRLAKLDAGLLDAIVLALAGLKRLSLEDRVAEILEPRDWLPALAQGALAVEMRADDVHRHTVAEALDHTPTAIVLACEREFQAALGGSCRTPIAGHAWIEENALHFRGEVLAPDGSDWEETSMAVTLGPDARIEAARAGREAGCELKPRTRSWLEL